MTNISGISGTFEILTNGLMPNLANSSLVNCGCMVSPSCWWETIATGFSNWGSTALEGFVNPGIINTPLSLASTLAYPLTGPLSTLWGAQGLWDLGKTGFHLATFGGQLPQGKIRTPLRVLLSVIYNPILVCSAEGLATRSLTLIQTTKDLSSAGKEAQKDSIRVLNNANLQRAQRSLAVHETAFKNKVGKDIYKTMPPAFIEKVWAQMDENSITSLASSKGNSATSTLINTLSTNAGIASLSAPMDFHKALHAQKDNADFKAYLTKRTELHNQVTKLQSKQQTALNTHTPVQQMSAYTAKQVNAQWKGLAENLAFSSVFLASGLTERVTPAFLQNTFPTGITKETLETAQGACQAAGTSALSTALNYIPAALLANDIRKEYNAGGVAALISNLPVNLAIAGYFNVVPEAATTLVGSAIQACSFGLVDGYDPKTVAMVSMLLVPGVCKAVSSYRSSKSFTTALLDGLAVTQNVGITAFFKGITTRTLTNGSHAIAAGLNGTLGCHILNQTTLR